MNSGRVLFGFAPSEVEKHIAMLEAQLHEKKKYILRLEHNIQMLRFENEELEQKLIIANEIHQYRNAQAQIPE